MSQLLTLTYNTIIFIIRILTVGYFISQFHITSLYNVMSCIYICVAICACTASCRENVRVEMGDVEGFQSVSYWEDPQKKELVAQVHSKLQTLLHTQNTTRYWALCRTHIRSYVFATSLTSHLPSLVVDDGVEKREDRYLQVG